MTPDQPQPPPGPGPGRDREDRRARGPAGGPPAVRIAIALAAAAASLASLGPAPSRVPRPTDGSGGSAAICRLPAPPEPARVQGLDVPYNARFTFTRVRYESSGFRRRGWGSAWAHDYPDADRNLQTILAALTALVPNTTGSNVVDLEDTAIFRSPILYMSEPGFWSITQAGAENLRAFLLKGGFLIFDDFEAEQWDNMAAQVARALPEGEWVEIDVTHPLFQGFFAVEDIYVPHPLVRVHPAYYAIFEDNDPGRRIMVVANHNADLAEYWEWSAQGYFPVDPTNAAYQLGVNYIIYGMTH
jgi:hypothetical protein